MMRPSFSRSIRIVGPSRTATLNAEEALAAFSALRVWNVSLVRGLAPAARERRLTHPERGEMSFQTVIETMGGHDLNHLAQLESLGTSAA